MWETDILSKDAGHRPAPLLKITYNYRHLYLQFHSSTYFFKHFASKIQLPGFYIRGTFVKND